MQPIPASLSCGDQVSSSSSSDSSSDSSSGSSSASSSCSNPDSPVDDICCRKLTTWRQCCVRCPCLARCPLEVSRHCAASSSLQQPQHAAPASWEHRGHRRLSQDATICPQPRPRPPPGQTEQTANSSLQRGPGSMFAEATQPRVAAAGPEAARSCSASPAASQHSTQPRAAAGRVQLSWPRAALTQS